MEFKIKTSKKSKILENETKSTQRTKIKKENQEKMKTQEINNVCLERVLPANEFSKDSSSKKKSKKSKVDRYEEMLNHLYRPVTMNENKVDLNTEISRVTMKKKPKLCDDSSDSLTTMKKKMVKKSKIESHGKASLREKMKKHNVEQFNEYSDEKPKKKPKKTKAELAEEYIKQMYPPVTVDDAWLKEYENKLIPTVPHNMSRDEFIRGFYTFGPEFVSSPKAENQGKNP